MDETREKSKIVRKPVPLEVRERIVREWENRANVRFKFIDVAKRYGLYQSQVSKIIIKYKRTGQIENLKVGGRKRLVTTPENMKRMAEVLEKNPKISQRALARELDIHWMSVRIMLKELRNRGSEGQKEESGGGGGGEEPSYPVQEPSVELDFLDDEPPPPPPVSPGDDDSSCRQDYCDGVPCFLCDAAEGTKELDCGFLLPPTASVPPPLEVERSVGVVCFLKEVMELELKDLKALMEEAEGRSPSEWGISICSDPDCKGVVEQTYELWKEMKKLELKLKEKRKEIVGKIRRSCNVKAEGGKRGTFGKDQAVVNERVREVLRRRMMAANERSRNVRAAGEEEEEEGRREVKVEVDHQAEGFNDFGDHFFDDSMVTCDNDVNVNSPLEEEQDTVVKVQSNDDEKPGMRSSRMKRGVKKLKPGDPSKRAGAGGGGSSKGLRKSSEVKTKSKLRLKGKGLGSKAGRRVARPGEMVYECQACPDLGEMDKDEFIAHIGFHSRSPNKCAECDVHFPQGVTDEQLQKHWEERHQDLSAAAPKIIHVPSSDAIGKIWLCSKPKCKLKFGSADERNAHQLKAHVISGPSSQFTCSTCSSNFYDTTEVRLHKALEHPKDVELSCCYCDSRLAINTDRDHIQFLNLDHLKKHIAEVHPERVYVNHEGKRTSAIIHLQTCPLCGRVFRSVNYTKLDRHLTWDHGLKLYENYSCPICSKKMRHVEAWKHTKQFHWPDAPRTFICQYCGKGFRSSQNRRDHEEIHKNKETRPYQCELCGSSYAVANYLYIHKRTAHQNHVWPSSAQRRKREENDKAPSGVHLDSTIEDTVNSNQNQKLGRCPESNDFNVGTSSP